MSEVRNFEKWWNLYSSTTSAVQPYVSFHTFGVFSYHKQRYQEGSYKLRISLNLVNFQRNIIALSNVILRGEDFINLYVRCSKKFGVFFPAKCVLVLLDKTDFVSKFLSTYL